METENKTFREPGIDVLKGICILFIIITHYGWSETQRLKFLFPFWIDLAVPIFMVISGYVNARTFESREVKDYSTALQLKNIKRPFLRYTVPYLVVLIVEIAIWGGERNTMDKFMYTCDRWAGTWQLLLSDTFSIYICFSMRLFFDKR